MSLSLSLSVSLRISSSSFAFPIPPPSHPSFLLHVPPNCYFVFCRYRRRHPSGFASTRGGRFRVRSFSAFGVHGSGSEGEEDGDDDDDQRMRRGVEDEAVEEEEGGISSLVLPERWDVLGLGQAMVIPLLHSSNPYFFFFSFFIAH